MVNKFARTVVMAALGSAFSLGAIPAQAALSWTFGSNSTQCPSNFCGGGRSVDSVGVADDGTSNVNVNVTAWYAAVADLNFAEAGLYQWSGGLGVVEAGGSTAEPNHSFDNGGGFDFMLLEFDTDVDLDFLRIGWNGTTSGTNDEDISVMAYTGAATTVDANTSGWSTIGSYDLSVDPDGNNATASINAGDVSSSYWLIGAYSPAVGGCKTGNCVAGNDYMKLKVAAGNIYPSDDPGTPSSQVPEPSSLLLLSLGMVAPLAMRRRRGKLAAAKAVC